MTNTQIINKPTYKAINHREEFAKLLMQPFRRDTVALHGTTSESIIKLLETGSMPITLSERQGTFYFAQIYENLPTTIKRKLNDSDHSFEGAFALAGEYAKSRESELLIRNLLKKKGIDANIDIADLGFLIDGEDPVRPISDPDLKKLREMDRIVFRGLRRRGKEECSGVILGINESIVRYPIEVEDSELLVHFGENFDISYITGIRPLGKREHDLIIKALGLF